jgi:hypothetical protein
VRQGKRVYYHWVNRTYDDASVEVAMNADELKAGILGEMISASQAKVAEMEQDLETERRVLAALRQKLAAVTGGASGYSHSCGNTPTAPADASYALPLGVADDLEEGRVPQRILAILMAAGRPMTVDEIVSGVEAGGFRTDAQKGTRGLVFSALGRRHDLFRRVRRGLYGLAGRPTEATNGRQE